jgi:hypothetical protein
MGLTTRSSAHVRVPDVAWTIMVYDDADNELEKPMLDNLSEMLHIGSSDKVQIVALFDRSPKTEPKDQYSDEPIGGLKFWTGTRLLHVEKDHLRTLADWGDVNVGDKATLTRFVSAAANAYPAQHYALIISDHGGGWREMCVDESHGDKALSLRDLREALEPFTRDHGKLDLVGLDMCLMGNFETAQALAPVAHMMIGSEELAPARGWVYEPVLKSLLEKPEMTSFDISRTVIDDYTIFFNNTPDASLKFESSASTLSLLDLDHFADLQQAVSTMADRCVDSLRGKQRPGWISVARARAGSEEYGTLGASGEGGEEMHDLMQITQILQQSGDPALTAAAQNVENRVKQVVRYGMRGPLRPHSSGISIYFPTDGIDLNDADSAAYLSDTFARESHWVNFLDLYAVAVHDFSHAPALAPIKASADVASLQSPGILLTKAPDDDIAKEYVIVLAHDGPDMLLIGRMPTRRLPDGTIGQRFNGLWFSLGDPAKGSVTCPIAEFESLDANETQYLAYVDAQIKRAGEKDWTDACFVFSTSLAGGTPTGRLVYAFAATKEGPLELRLHHGDSVRTVYQRVTQNGDLEKWTLRGDGILIDRPEDFMLRWGLMGKGLYQVGFEVVNLAGDVNVEVKDIRLE